MKKYKVRCLLIVNHKVLKSYTNKIFATNAIQAMNIFKQHNPVSLKDRHILFDYLIEKI